MHKILLKKVYIDADRSNFKNWASINFNDKIQCLFKNILKIIFFKPYQRPSGSQI